ncbi:DUF262 domain-containing protein [Flavobacterium quisquiliarum]|uniref:DUF262 domain-containing protein n=1 Tax=Flavobacterium quisquiliarum TaxID=1834436 RepID=A0ABV8W640_9FLAO|nr:DUF262 domain-containing protein [Flavobacterium quisquiliarum]MBW1654927.1 DUF262 domain-containing protein [Flavobacterium quisquiliarum]
MSNKNEDSVVLTDFLSKFQLKISDYQRPYIWNFTQFLKLYKDLIDYKTNQEDSTPLYYLGNIILVKNNNGEYDIIDGQQRITSLLILANLLDQKEAFGCNKDLEITSTISKDNIKANASYFRHYITGNLEKIKFENINITYIIAENQDQAFKFYTTLNTSGKRLNGLDIVKPFHLQAVDKEKQEEKARLFEEYQFSNNLLDNIIKRSLRIRYWVGFPFRDFPRNHEDSWKEILPEEFANIEMQSGHDYKYATVVEEKGISTTPDFTYQINQPLYKGENAIHYLIHWGQLWMKIEKKLKSEIFDKLDKLKGVEFHKEYYEMALLCYASKYGGKAIEDECFSEIAKVLFKVCFYTRLTKPCSKISIQKKEEENQLLKRILYSFDRNEIINYCSDFFDESTLKDSAKITTGRIQAFKDSFGYKNKNYKQPFFNQ